MIPLHFIPLLSVALFLIIVLVGATLSTRNVTTLREYITWDRQLPTPTLVMTVLATAFGGGSLMRHVEQIYTGGNAWVYIVLISSLSFSVISFLASRAELFMHNLSMPESIGRVYGKQARIIAAFVGIVSLVIGIAIQINVMSIAIGMVLPAINAKLIVLFTFGILVFYTTIGGVHIATFTHTFYMLIFVIILPIFLYAIAQKHYNLSVDNVQVLGAQVSLQGSIAPNENLSMFAIIMLGLSFMVSYIQPAIIQRMYMASDHIHAARVFFYASLFGIVMKIMIVSLPLLVKEGASNLSTSELWRYIMEVLPTPYQGGIVIAFLTLSMSTAEAHLNTCAVLVSHDLVQCFIDRKGVDFERQLKLAKMTVVAVGACATVLSFCCSNLLTLLMFFFDLYIPIIVAPFVLAILGFRGASHTALAGMITGFVTIIVWKLWIEPLTGINGSFICMVCNGLAMTVAHYLTKKTLS